METLWTPQPLTRLEKTFRFDCDSPFNLFFFPLRFGVMMVLLTRLLQWSFDILPNCNSVSLPYCVVLTAHVENISLSYRRMNYAKLWNVESCDVCV